MIRALLMSPLLVLLAGHAAVHAQRPSAALQEVAEGVFVRQGQHRVVFEADNIANVGAVIGSHCTAVIDSGGSPTEGRALRRAVEALSPSPICYVINTHAHPDHILGNVAFVDIDGLSFVGHNRMAHSSAAAKSTWLQRLAEQQGSPSTEQLWLMPTVAISEETSLDLGDRQLLLSPLATAHSDSDLSVYDQKTATLWLSDLLFVGHVPVLSGSVSGWASTLERIAKHPAERYIPGHGPTVLLKSDPALQLNLRYLKRLTARVKADLDKGLSLFDAQQSATTERHPDWQLFEQYHPRNVAKAWAELEWLD